MTVESLTPWITLGVVVVLVWVAITWWIGRTR